MTPTWADIKAAGGADKWIQAKLARQGLREGSTDFSKLNEEQRKLWKARREQERNVRKSLHKDIWRAYKAAHLVHLGVGVFHHDTAELDRFDIAEPERRRQENALPALDDVEALSTFLGLSVPRLRWLAYHREVDRNTHYVRWTIPKADGGRRLISAPKPTLKRVQRALGQAITEHLPVHGAAHGFLTDRSIRTNALVHAGAALVVHMDVKDFYPTITWKRVKGILRKAGYGEQVSTVMALLCTEPPREAMEIRGKTYHVATGPRSLPQGAPTSPSLTNTLCLGLDGRLAGLSAKLGCRYTRYADDLTFSFDNEALRASRSTHAVGRLLRMVPEILRDEGFVVHPKKTRLMRRGARQNVTGLVVNEAPGRPAARVPRQVVRRLRAAIFNRQRGKAGGPETVEQLKGWAAFVMMTDPTRGRAFMDAIDALPTDTNPALSEDTP